MPLKKLIVWLVLETNELMALIYEISKGQNWKRGKRDHFFMRNNIFGYNLEIRNKHARWTIMRNGFWRIVIVGDIHFRRFSGESHTFPILNGVGNASYFEDLPNQLDKDCVLLRLFLPSILAEYEELLRRWRV